MQELIPILISKDDGRGNFVKAEQCQIEKVGQEVANTLTCHEPGFSVHHSNMCIVAMKGICNTLTTVQKDNLVLENIIIGGMQEHQSIKNDGVCTTLTSSMGTGGGYVPMVVEEETIKIKQATKKGYTECKINGVADFSFPDSKTRRGRVEQNGDVSPTLMAGNSEIVKIEKVGQISNEGSQCGTVVSTEGLYPTISAGCHGYANPHILEKNGFYEQAIKTAEENNAQEGKKTAILPVVEKYKIRKLTPKECWRLMGFTDEDFEKAAMVNSNSQLYKQAGNSIVKNVLMAIFNKMVVTA